jgi:hypothetical protein
VIGATNPTFGNGAAAPGTLNSTSTSLSGNFTNNTINTTVVANAGGFTYTGTASGSITSSTFTGSGTGTAGAGCSGGCTLGVNGFFAGNGATRAGFVYQFGQVTVGGATTLNGAVALTR